MKIRLPEEKIILSQDSLRELVKDLKSKGKIIVFTNGCFDIIHPGHIKILFEAKKQGDVLIVGINDDDSIRRLKGQDRPILPLSARQIVLAAIEAVDYVVSFSEDTPEKLIKEIEPDVLVKGEDWSEDKIVGADFVKSKGGKVIRVKLVEGFSTSNIIKKIRRERNFSS
jgi:rfaE bifunctional protein nucleotidyltransferase chain/domain